MKHIRRFLALFLVLLLCLQVMPVPTRAAGAPVVNVGQTVKVRSGKPWLQVPDFNYLRWVDFATAPGGCLRCGWTDEYYDIELTGLKPSEAPIQVYLSWCAERVWQVYNPRLNIYESRHEDVTGYVEFYVVVTDRNPPTALSLPAQLELPMGQSETLPLTVTPADALYRVQWSSENPQVATVNRRGQVQAVDAGVTTITATAHNGLTASCTVTVPAPYLQLTASTPEEGAEAVSRTAPLTLTYDRTLQPAGALDQITLADQSLPEIVPVTAAVEGQTLTVTPEYLRAGHAYELSVPVGAVTNAYGKPTEENTLLHFTTETLRAAEVWPADGERNISVNPELSVFYDDFPFFGETPPRLTNADTGEEILLDGEIQDQTLLLWPWEELERQQTYNLLIPADCVTTDTGLPAAEDVSISFTTAAGRLYLLQSQPETGCRNHPVSAPLQLTFDAPISLAYEDPFLYLAEKETQNMVRLTPQIDGAVLTLTPETPLEPGRVYVLELAANTVSNENGYSNQLITLEFTTFSEGSTVPAAPTIRPQKNCIELRAQEGAAIYYTLDGSSPLTHGIPYTGPVTPPNACGYLRAAAVQNGMASPIVFYPLDAYGAYDGPIFSQLPDGEEYLDLTPVADGFLAAGTTKKAGQRSQAAIFRLNPEGTLMWSQTVSIDLGSTFHRVLPTADGCLAVGSTVGTLDGDHYYRKALCASFTADGQQRWCKAFDFPLEGSSQNDQFCAVFDTGSTPGTEFTCFGSDQIGSTTIPYYMVLDAQGNLLRQQALPQIDNYEHLTAVQRLDTGWLLMTNHRFYLLGDDGQVQWEHFDPDWYLEDLCLLPDGFSVVGSLSKYSVTDYDGLVFCYDTQGRELWRRYISSNTYDRFYDICPSKNGLAVAATVSPSDPPDGDWAFLDSFTGSGSNGLALEFSPNGDLLYAKRVGSFDGYAGFYAICPTETGFAVAGSAFDEFSYSNRTINGPSDGMFLAVNYEPWYLHNYPVEQVPGNYIRMSGPEAVHPGESFALELTLTVPTTFLGLVCQLEYPAWLTLERSFFPSLNLTMTEKTEGSKKILTISAPMDYDKANVTDFLGTLWFHLDPSCPADALDVTWDQTTTQFWCHEYFGYEYEDYFSYHAAVTPALPLAMAIQGPETIGRQTEYQLKTVPAEADPGTVTWSVSDPALASVDRQGRLTPLQPGTVTLTAKAGALEASRQVTIPALQGTLDSLTCTDGVFARDYAPQEFDRTLYLNQDAETVTLTASYTGGTLTAEDGTVLKSGVPTTLNIGYTPALLILTRSQPGAEDTVFLISVELREQLTVRDATLRQGIATINLTANARELVDQGLLLCVAYRANGQMLHPVWIDRLDLDPGATDLEAQADCTDLQEPFFLRFMLLDGFRALQALMPAAQTPVLTP